MENKQVMFSIIIPIYNPHVKYLDECVSSLLNQTFDNYEVLLIDDGSMEMIANMCDRFMKTDRRIRVFHQDNEGVSAARNRGIDAANGEWLFFLDADDWIEPNTLEKLSEYLFENKCDILFFRSQKERKNTHISVIENGLEDNHTYYMYNLDDCEFLYHLAMRPANIIKDSISHDTFYYVWNKLFSSHLIKDHHIYFPIGVPNSEDKVFVLNCLQNAQSIYSISDIFHHYRILDYSATRKYSETADTDRKYLLGLIKQIALEMDKHLGEMCGQADLHIIMDDYELFAYQMCTSVLLQKFYHPDYPFHGLQRKQNAILTLNEEPYLRALEVTATKDIMLKEKIRVWLLMHKFYFLFVLLCRIKQYFTN